MPEAFDIMEYNSRISMYFSFLKIIRFAHLWFGFNLTPIEKIIIKKTNNFGQAKLSNKHKVMDKIMLHAFFGILIFKRVSFCPSPLKKTLGARCSIRQCALDST